MARTIGDVVVGARVILQDLLEPYRYTDSELIKHACGAAQRALQLRPDLFANPFAAPGAYTATTAFPVDERYFDEFTVYVAGFAELRDDRFTQDSRAAILLARFDSSLRGSQ